jgi:general secretion pathway protein B
MSIILDALRRADAQREGDPARGIHAQPSTLPDPYDEPRPAWQRKLAWTVPLMLVVVGGGFAGWWTWLRAPAVQQVAAPVQPPVPAALVQTATAETRPLDAIVPAAPPPPPEGEPQAQGMALRALIGNKSVNVAQAGAIAPATAPEPGSTSAPPEVNSRSMSARPPATPSVAPAGQSPAAPMAAPTSPATVPPPRAASGPVAPSVPTPPVKGLPADAPRVTITGGVYSADVSRRMLIVNGQVYAEGAEAAPGITIEQIRPSQAVLVYRGQRYTVTF